MKKRKSINIQFPGRPHMFPCGCSGILSDKSNKFTVVVSGRNKCRVARILGTSQRVAKRDGCAPINIKTPHSVIRELMEVKLCWLCKQPMDWVFGKKTTPHLHHDHKTGEIYGFTHPRCNSEALEREIDELRKRIKELEKIVLDKSTETCDTLFMERTR